MQGEKRGRYLYADYTPLEQNMDLLSQLKDFTNLSNAILKAQKDYEFLRIVLAGAGSMEAEIASRIDQLHGSLEDILNNYNNRYGKPLQERFPIPNHADPFAIARGTLKSDTIRTRETFLRLSDNYRRYINSRIEESLTMAFEALNELISKGYEKLPYTVTSRLRKGLEISIDDTLGEAKRYSILLTNTLLPPKDAEGVHGNSISSNPISYSLSVKSTELEFWNQRRKVSEFGLKDVLVPVGFKTPMTQKLKKSLDFIPGLDKQKQSPTQKEPRFVNVEDYYVYSATTDGMENFIVLLVDDTSNPDENSVRIRYSISELDYSSSDNNSGAHPNAHYIDRNKLPRIDLVLPGEGKVQDILGIKDIAEATAIQKIMLLGRAILDKIELVMDYEPTLLGMYSKLSSARVDGKDALVTDASKKASRGSGNDIVIYDSRLVVAFLETVANYYSPIIGRLREKSPASNELIIRFENADGSREERILRIDELDSVLKQTDGGTKIANALGIHNNEDEDNDLAATTTDQDDSTTTTSHTE